MKETEEKYYLVDTIMISENNYWKYFINEIRRYQTSENGKYTLIETDGVLVLKINVDHPLSEEELISYIRSDIRDKKIDDILKK